MDLDSLHAFTVDSAETPEQASLVIVNNYLLLHVFSRRNVLSFDRSLAHLEISLQTGSL